MLSVVSLSPPTEMAVWEELKKRLPPLTFRNWISPLQLTFETNSVLIVTAPTAFHQERVKRSHFATLQSVVAFLYPEQNITVELRVDAKAQFPNPDSWKLSVSPGTCYLSDSKQTDPNPRTAPLDTLAVAKKSPIHSASNDMLIRVIEDYAKDPDRYDVMYIHGPSGSGKTACMRYFHQYLKGSLKHSVLYLTIDEFTGELVSAIQGHSVAQFRLKFKEKYDVIILDDCQMIGTRPKTQEELGHLLQYWKLKGIRSFFISQLPLHQVVTCGLLLSQLQSGLVVPVHPPDFEYIAQMISQEIPTLPPEMQYHLIQKCRDKIFSLHTIKGIINRVRVEVSLCGRHLTENDFATLVRELAPKSHCQAETSPAALLDVICQYYQIETSHLSSKSRAKRLNEARRVGTYLLRKWTSLSLSDIGTLMGRDHSTILYAYQKVTEEVNSNPTLARHIRLFEEKMGLLSTNTPAIEEGRSTPPQLSAEDPTPMLH